MNPLGTGSGYLGIRGAHFGNHWYRLLVKKQRKYQQGRPRIKHQVCLCQSYCIIVYYTIITQRDATYKYSCLCVRHEGV